MDGDELFFRVVQVTVACGLVFCFVIAPLLAIASAL